MNADQVVSGSPMSCMRANARPAERTQLRGRCCLRTEGTVPEFATKRPLSRRGLVAPGDIAPVIEASESLIVRQMNLTPKPIRLVVQITVEAIYPSSKNRRLVLNDRNRFTFANHWSVERHGLDDLAVR